MNEEEINLLLERVHLLEQALQANVNEINNVRVRVEGQVPDQAINALPEILSNMYSYYVLDSIIESVKLVSEESTTKPRHYRGVPANVADILANFRSRLGSDPDWPNANQRISILASLFGKSPSSSKGNNGSQFVRHQMRLISSATSFAERVYDTGEEMLRQSFRDSALVMRAYLNTLSGEQLIVSYRQLSNIFGSSIHVLRTDGVANRFGLPIAPTDPWPLDPGTQGDGAFLIEEIIKHLAPSYANQFNQERFISFQRVAFYGSQVIRFLLDGNLDDHDQLTELITTAYRWGTAIQSL